MKEIIVRTPDTCGGNPRIDGTRLGVHDCICSIRVDYDGDVLRWWREERPHLSLEQVLAMLGYFIENTAEIEGILMDRRRQYEEMLESQRRDHFERKNLDSPLSNPPAGTTTRFFVDGNALSKALEMAREKRFVSEPE